MRRTLSFFLLFLICVESWADKTETATSVVWDLLNWTQTTRASLIKGGWKTYSNNAAQKDNGDSFDEIFYYSTDETTGEETKIIVPETAGLLARNTIYVLANTKSGATNFLGLSLGAAVAVPVKAGQRVSVTGYHADGKDDFYTFDWDNVVEEPTETFSRSNVGINEVKAVAASDGYVTISNNSAAKGFFIRMIKVASPPDANNFLFTTPSTIGQPITASKTYTFDCEPLLNSQELAVKWTCRVLTSGSLQASVSDAGVLSYHANRVGDGGAIIVTATAEIDDAGVAATHVVTVPYQGNHVWQFSEVRSSDDLNQDVTLYSIVYPSDMKDQKTEILVRETVDGDNANYFFSTAGLLFHAQEQSFGAVASMKKEIKQGEWNLSDVQSIELMAFKGKGSQLIIPMLKAGYYVKLRLDSQDDVNGSVISTENLLDLNDKEITQEIQVTGVQRNLANMPGGIIFRVQKDGNVALTLQDEVWNHLYEIEISDTYQSDLKIVAEELDEYGIVHDGNGTKINLYRLPEKTMAAREKSASFEIKADENLQCSMLRSAEDASMQVVEIKEGVGNILITMDIKYGDYVLNRQQKWIAVGMLEPQDYPYTWDFSAHNMSGELSSTIKNVSSFKEKNVFGAWDTTAKYGMSVCGSEKSDVLFSIKNGKSVGLDLSKPLFANGSQLTCGTTFIPELRGIGFTLSHIDEDANNVVQLTGDGLSFSPKTSDLSLILTIPHVKKGQWVVVRASSSPEVENVNACYDFSTSDNVYIFEVEKEDVPVQLVFSNAVKISQLAVTDMQKSISKYGIATESRQFAVDYHYAPLISGHAIHAYFVTVFHRDNATVDISQVADDEIVAEGTGVILYESNPNGAYNMPLLVPACNVDRVKQEANMLKASVDETWVESEEDGYVNFVLTNVYYTDDDTARVRTEKPCFYRVEPGGGKMGKNKAWLQIPSSDVYAVSGSKKTIRINGLEDGDATNIMIETEKMTSQKNVIYDLSGRRVENSSSLQKGIYVKNKKKILVR